MSPSLDQTTDPGAGGFQGTSSRKTPQGCQTAARSDPMHTAGTMKHPIVPQLPSPPSNPFTGRWLNQGGVPVSNPQSLFIDCFTACFMEQH